jgi:2-polyprenyl-6-methoxyphenol hydroxylase-like FAD-dependent oxidoreductase
MDNRLLTTDVLIVGAGPVGLFLANECARRGMRFQLIEANAEQSKYSKALAIFPRTLEVFDMAGLAGPFLEKANRVTRVRIISADQELGDIPFKPENTPYSFVSMVPQNITEELLAQQLKSKGVEIEYGVEFLTAVEDDDGVLSTLQQNGERFQCRSAYVVGCDGPRSAVRHTIRIPMDGSEYPDAYMLADVDIAGEFPPNELLLCPTELGPVAVFPISATRRRIVATTKSADGEAPSLESVNLVLSTRAPMGLHATAMHWSSYFRIHRRHARHLRKGRMFLAGDSAHLHSPIGGQGMNTGLQDAWNLVWKLDLVLRGVADPALLDTYEAERLPVIKDVLETTHILTRVMTTPKKFAQVLRNLIVPTITHFAVVQNAFVQRLSEFGIHYEGSPIVEGHGERYLDDSMRGGEGIRSRFLLVLGPCESSVERDATTVANEVSDVVELRRTEKQGLKLVRPDGYVAFESKSASREDVSSVSLLLENKILARSRSKDLGRTA